MERRLAKGRKAKKGENKMKLGGQFKKVTGKSDQDFYNWCKAKGLPKNPQAKEQYCQEVYEEMKAKKRGNSEDGLQSQNNCR